jgi:hypothetical protein
MTALVKLLQLKMGWFRYTFLLYLYDLKYVVYCQNFHLSCNAVSHLLKCYFCIILFIVPLFIVCGEVIFSKGCSQFLIIYLVELYITTERIVSYRYIHCYFSLFRHFLVGRGTGAWGECWCIVHMQSAASVFSSPPLPVCDVEIVSVWYVRYPPNRKHSPLASY